MKSGLEMLAMREGLNVRVLYKDDTPKDAVELKALFKSLELIPLVAPACCPPAVVSRFSNTGMTRIPLLN